MRRILNFCMLAITILIMNLLAGYVTNYFIKYKGNINPLKFIAFRNGCFGCDLLSCISIYK